MSEAEVVSALIAEIYDAALDPALWRTVLQHVTGYTGGAAASLFAKDTATKGAEIFYDDGGIDRLWMDRYTADYSKADPTTTWQFFAGIEQLVSTTDVMPYDEFASTRFYTEWVRPQGLVDSLSVVLDKSGTNLAMFTVFRDRLVDDQARRRVRLIVPHIRRAALVAGLLEGKAGTAVSIADALDTIEAGVFLLDRQGRVVHANMAARAMIALGTPLGIAGNRLAAIGTDADRLLAAALNEIGDGDALPPHRRGIAMPISGQDGVLHVAHLLPLTARTQEASAHPQAIAVLFVRHASLGPVAAPEALAHAYGLTPTELRVLLAVVEIGGVPEVAEALGVAVTTVKFHLRQLFEKTGARRQADLVKLVVGFASPFGRGGD